MGNAAPIYEIIYDTVNKNGNKNGNDLSVGLLCEIAGVSRDILCYAMRTLRCCSIVAHVHDELIIEADRRMSLAAVCEQMGRTPPWAEGLILRADGYETAFYKKD